jgi:hypothetical protein
MLTMKLFFIIFGSLMTAFSLFGNYMAWFRDWGKKHYKVAKRYPFTPYALITLLGERFYIICYRIGVVIALIVSILLLVEGLNY